MGIKRRKGAPMPLIWLTVYGDFITNLTLFFILLFGSIIIALERGMSKQEMQEFMQGISSTVEQQAPAKKKEPDAKAQATKGEMDDIGGIDGVSINEKELRVTLPESVLFEPGKAKLKDEAKEALARIGAVIAHTPYTAVVEGHTDDLPITQKAPPGLERWQLTEARSSGLGPYNSNWELSAARSLQVINYLTGTKLLPPERLVSRACGPSEPRVPNDTTEHRAQNRRIDIRLQLKTNQ